MDIRKEFIPKFGVTTEKALSPVCEKRVNDGRKNAPWLGKRNRIGKEGGKRVVKCQVICSVDILLSFNNLLRVTVKRPNLNKLNKPHEKDLE